MLTNVMLKLKASGNVLTLLLSLNGRYALLQKNGLRSPPEKNLNEDRSIL